VVLLSIPGLRPRDVAAMPALDKLVEQGERAELVPSFPCVTWPVQANMLTGKLPAQHGVIANGFYWRDRRQVEMWTAWNDKITAPQIWDLLHQRDPGITSAVWFPMLSKGCGADFVCMPAPVHNPDGTESLWCYTKPTELYGELRDAIGHFPLQHFWGPLANIKSTAWIADSAVIAARKFRPQFSYIYLPHLDYAAQKSGPDSPVAVASLGELDREIQKLVAGFHEVWNGDVLWLVAGEYAIVPVDHVSYPNCLLRQEGFLQVREEPDGEHLDFETSRAWALVDHQFSHVFVEGRDPATIRRVAELFRGQPGIAEVLAGDQRARYSIQHERAGDVILISTPDSWQAYYWWLENSRAPAMARTVDIHRKPGYDPVELHFDMATKSIPLDATRIKGSHGAPVTREEDRTIVLASAPVLGGRRRLADTDICSLVLDQFS
jgi:predicted AlkP superfamily pyrophosphatase or phosphodiesterase